MKVIQFLMKSDETFRVALLDSDERPLRVTLRIIEV